MEFSLMETFETSDQHLKQGEGKGIAKNLVG